MQTKKIKKTQEKFWKPIFKAFKLQSLLIEKKP
jgi:hypothetical protein